jgi:hypothetical protein
LVVLNFHVRDICSKTQIWIVRYVCSISVYVANTYYFGMVSVNLVLDFCVLKISIFIIVVLLDLVWPTIWRCLLHWTELGLWKECNDIHEHIFCICQSNQSSTKVHLYENQYFLGSSYNWDLYKDLGEYCVLRKMIPSSSHNNRPIWQFHID